VTGSVEGGPPSGWRRWISRLEPVLWVVLLGFVLVRLGPQIGAWTGISFFPDDTTPRVPEWEAVVLAHPDGVSQVVGSDPFRGDVQVLTFWATWCRICALELPGIERLHARWGDEVRFLALAIDDLPGAAGAGPMVRAHADEKGYTFPIALADRSLRMAFGGIPGVPTTFVLDRDGVIRHTLIGVTAPGTLDRAVRRLVEAEPEFR
jgi:cytochrome c biogenesis protein CcmG, thiol:disulfide interchange protein DsbE